MIDHEKAIYFSITSVLGSVFQFHTVQRFKVLVVDWLVTCPVPFKWIRYCPKLKINNLLPFHHQCVVLHCLVSHSPKIQSPDSRLVGYLSSLLVESICGALLINNILGCRYISYTKIHHFHEQVGLNFIMINLKPYEIKKTEQIDLKLLHVDIAWFLWVKNIFHVMKI